MRVLISSRKPRSSIPDDSRRGAARLLLQGRRWTMILVNMAKILPSYEVKEPLKETLDVPS